MKVLLIAANTETINMPTIPAGLGAVASATENAGHEVHFLDLMNVSDLTAAVRKAVSACNPGAIGVSVRNIDDQSRRAPRFLLEKVKDVVAACRAESRAPVVLGGAGYSIFPAAALDYLAADYGIRGDGELGFPALLSRLERGGDPAGVPGLHRPGMPVSASAHAEDLDSLPLPDPKWFGHYLGAADKIWMPFQTRRGCPMDCSYCSTCAIEGRHIRKRAIGGIIEALRSYVDAGFRQFYFVDNTFNLPPSYARELCEAIIGAELGITWRCIVYPKDLDAELAGLMARAGCREASLGFESGSENMLHVLNKRYRPEEVRAIASILGGSGIKRMGFLLLGGPGETVETAEESLLFADSLKLENMRVSAGIRIYPYTRLAETAVEEGVIAADDNLLQPRFYLQKGLEDWLPKTVEKWAAERPSWII